MGVWKDVTGMVRHAVWTDATGTIRVAYRAARLAAYRHLNQRAYGATAMSVGGESKALPTAGVDVDVVLYFADGPENLYQLRQWLPVLERLDERHRVAILTRRIPGYEEVSRLTELPVLLIRFLRDLELFYVTNDVKLCLYVNAHQLNFQSLTFPDQLHVHLNHGESDKISMASNQAKAYDFVAVAGNAAVERYHLNLINFDGRSLLKVGRPQLDLLAPSRTPPGGGRTVLYAPTWEGGRDAMNYSSVATMGQAIVRALLDGGWRVVYRPHPKTGNVDPATRVADDAIRRLITSAAGSDGALGHLVSVDEPLGELFADADVLVADLSSVILDFLATGKPFLVARPDARRGVLLRPESSSDAAGYPLRPEDIDKLSTMLDEILEHDPRRAERLATLEHFFGDTTPGASTQRFLQAIDGLVAERDRLVADKRARLAGERL